MTRARIFPYLVLIGALSLADWALTWDALQSNWAHELNPVAALMLAHGPTASLLLKMAVILPGCAALYVAGTRRWVYLATVALAWVYVGLIVWHCVGRLACG